MLAAKLNDEQVACGSIRGTGVLTDIDLRAFDPELGSLGRTRRIAGPAHVLALEGTIGLSGGEVAVTLRGIIARETDRGLETFAGEIASARTIALEVVVTAMDDLSLELALDGSTGLWLLGTPSNAPSAVPPAAASAPAASPAWSSAVQASDRAEPARPRPQPTASSPMNAPMALPARPPRVVKPELDTPAPEAGDIVEHFAFGSCEVARSDGDRLHLRVGKDGRIREIALEMLRVTRLPDSEDGKRRFKLERRL